MALLARAKELEAQGRSIIHMEIGEPDFVTPEPVIKAAQESLTQGLTHYTPAIGMPELREAISAYYQSRDQVYIPAQDIVVTPGASGALMLILGVLIDSGDKVLMSDPGYPCNRHFVSLMGGEAIGIPVDADSQYQLTLDGVKRRWDSSTKAVMLASPANPTGTVIPDDELKAIVAFVEQQRGYVIVDEIYHGLIYANQAKTAAGMSDCVFVINSFSKYFNMTGWRLGWLVAPRSANTGNSGHVSEAVRNIDKLAQNIFLAPPTISQCAALAAFSAESLAILEQRKSIFRERRDYLLPALRELGFTISVPPQGAFYLYADCGKLLSSDYADSFQLSETLLEQAGVAITPGIDFGHHKPGQHVRFAYTTSIDKLEEGVSRLKAFFKQ
jgi:aspartate/methionine/tyrosine aminotransferase